MFELVGRKLSKMKLLFFLVLIYAFLNVVYLQRESEQEENERKWREHVEYMQRLNQEQQLQQEQRRQLDALTPIFGAPFGR